MGYILGITAPHRSPASVGRCQAIPWPAGSLQAWHGYQIEGQPLISAASPPGQICQHPEHGSQDDHSSNDDNIYVLDLFHSGRYSLISLLKSSLALILSRSLSSNIWLFVGANFIFKLFSSHKRESFTSPSRELTQAML